ncbi:MAG: AAA family ATPase [Lentisphaerota bacterium]
MSKHRTPYKDDLFNKLDMSWKNNANQLLDNQLLTPSGKIITFNDQQYEGINKIRAWLKSDKTFFTLSGYAGTGKTLSIKKILDEYHYGVVVSAPTHKAVNVIERLTGEEAKTLHSLLGLRPDLEISGYDPNFPIFNPIVPPKINDYNFCVIDEASMINLCLFNLIKDTVGGHRTKILFVGDIAQLPPVNEEISAVFVQNDIEIHTLTKVERQSNDNPLLFLYDDLRNNLNSIDGGFLRKSNVNGLGEGVIFTINKQEFRKAVIERFSSNEFQKNSNYCKGIAWKNSTVMAANKIVRTALLGDKTDVIEKRDLLMAYRTITNDKQNYNIIENSADYHVVEKSNLEENKYEIKGFQVKLREDLPKGKLKFDDVFIVDSNDHENLHQYAEMHDFFRDMAKSNKKQAIFLSCTYGRCY